MTPSTFWLAICVVYCSVVGLWTKTVPVSPEVHSSPLFRFAAPALRRRQAPDEQTATSHTSLPCGDEHLLEQQQCMSPVNSFISDVNQAFSGAIPFNTGSNRVGNLCQNAPAVVQCLAELGRCGSGLRRDTMQVHFNYVCSEQGRQQLTHMDGDRCRPEIDENEATLSCVEAQRRFRPSVDENGDEVGTDLNSTVAGRQAACAHAQVEVQCERAGLLLKCGPDAANFMAGIMTYMNTAMGLC